MKMIANGCPILHTAISLYYSYAASVKSSRQLSISLVVPDKSLLTSLSRDIPALSSKIAAC